MNLDRYGLIISGGDGGDTCNRVYTTTFRLLLNFKLFSSERLPLSEVVRSEAIKKLAPMNEFQKLLEIEPGIYVRHPDPLFWGSDPRNCSRDQLTPVICLLAFLSSYRHDLGASYRTKLWDLLKECLKRYMFAQNIYPNWIDPRLHDVKEKMPDFINFEIWGIFARGWINTWWFPLALPVIFFGDFFLLLAALFKVFAPISEDGTLKFRMPGPDDVDDDNINSLLMAAQYTYQTPFSWLARKIYKVFRSKNYGNTELGEKNPIMGALVWYHKEPAGNPEIAELARPIVERY